jgi:hypothetical protein
MHTPWHHSTCKVQILSILMEQLKLRPRGWVTFPGSQYILVLNYCCAQLLMWFAREELDIRGWGWGLSELHRVTEEEAKRCWSSFPHATMKSPPHSESGTFLVFFSSLKFSHICAYSLISPYPTPFHLSCVLQGLCFHFPLCFTVMTYVPET